MNMQHAIEFVGMLRSLFPSKESKSEAAKAWGFMLEKYELSEAKEALREFSADATNLYSPTPTQITAIIKRNRASASITKAYKAPTLPVSNVEQVKLEHYELNGRTYVRASKGARSAILAQYERMKRRE